MGGGAKRYVVRSVMMLCVRVCGVEWCFMRESVQRLVLLYGVVDGGHYDQRGYW